MSLSGKQFKYLQLAIPEKSVNMLDGDLQMRLERDNSIFAKDIKVQEFTFTAEDYNVLKEYREQAIKYRLFGKQYLNYVYIKAAAVAANYLNLDMKDGITSMVKRFSPHTIDEYGSRIAPALFLLLNASRLSCFQNASFVSEELAATLKQDLDSLEGIPRKMRVLGELFSECIESDLHREYLVRWVRLCAFRFHEWDIFTSPCPENTVTRMRKLMDVIRCPNSKAQPPE